MRFGYGFVGDKCYHVALDTGGFVVNLLVDSNVIFLVPTYVPKPYRIFYNILVRIFLSDLQQKVNKLKK